MPGRDRMIRRMSVDDIAEASDLYMRNMFESALVLFGPGFIRSMIDGMVRSASCLAYVYEADRRVRGFIISAFDIRRFWACVLLKTGFRAAAYAVGSIVVDPSRLAHMIAMLRHGSKAPVPGCGAELLFIVVEPAYERRGIASALITHVLNGLAQRHIEKACVSICSRNDRIRRVLTPFRPGLIDRFDVNGRRMERYAIETVQQGGK